MKIVNAVWDQRNFGIRCAEIELETADRAEVNNSFKRSRKRV